VLEALEAQLKAAKQARGMHGLMRSRLFLLVPQVLLEQDGVSEQESQETHELVRRWRAKVCHDWHALLAGIAPAKTLLRTHL
jgi:hypothetical protein